MARFIHPKIISAAVARLGESRASRSVLNFLVFKRASILEHETVVSFSANNLSLGAAVDDLAACAQHGAHLPQHFRNKPYVNVFGSSGSPWQYLGKNWRTNGTGPALSGAAWRGIIDIVGECPRKGQLSEDYARKLPSVMLKAGKQLPTLTDAAIWYHRADDLEARFGAVADTIQLDERLRASFIEQLGLTDEEIVAIFDAQARPLASQPLADVLQGAVADPQEYLPDLGDEDTGSGELTYKGFPGCQAKIGHDEKRGDSSFSEL